MPDGAWDWTRFALRSPEAVAGELGMEFLGELPLDIEIRETSDQGRPIVVSAPEPPNAKTYRSIAQRLWSKISGQDPDALAKPAPRIVMQ